MSNSLSNINNIKIINAIVGMCKKDKKWPTVLRDLGYSVLWLEYQIKTHQNKLVKPDLIIESTQEKNALIIEGKTGGVDKDSHQFKNYESLSVDDVIQKLFCHESTNTFDVTFFSLKENETTIKKCFKDNKLNFPLIAIRDQEIKLILNKIQNKKTHDTFKNGIPIDIDKIPMGYIHYNESSSLSEIAPYVVRSLVAFEAKNEKNLSIEKIVADSFGSLWDKYSDEKARNQIRGKVKQILQKASKGELSNFLKKVKVKSGEEFWQLEYNNKKSLTPPTNRLIGLKSQTTNFLKKLRDDEISGQMSLPRFLDAE